MGKGTIAGCNVAREISLNEVHSFISFNTHARRAQPAQPGLYWSNQLSMTSLLWCQCTDKLSLLVLSLLGGGPVQVILKDSKNEVAHKNSFKRLSVRCILKVTKAVAALGPGTIAAGKTPECIPVKYTL